MARRGTLVVPEDLASGHGLDRPTISSARRSSICPIGLGLPTEAMGFKSLPVLQLHRKKGPLICSKLCETMHRSTAGHMFELSSARDCYPFLEYNSLHDPHLKSYYHHPEMKKKLIKNGYVTRDLYVICRSLREYNAYRNFLESEFMKLYKAKEDAVKERERREKPRTSTEQQRRQSNIEREEKRKQFFKQQEKKLRAKEFYLHRREKQEYVSKLKLLEERRMQRERNEIRREAEREQRKLRLLQREHEDASRRKSILKQCEAEERMRQIHLTQMRKEEKMKHLNELERKWQKYEEHAQMAREEEEQRKTREKEDRDRRMRKREKIFQLLRQREEERKAKLQEENHHQVEQLKEQADNLEKKWLKEKENEVYKWKETIQKKREHWDHFVSNQKEVTRKEQEKHRDELLRHTHLPSITMTTSRIHKYGSPSAVSRETSQGTSDLTPPTTVRFTATPTVHILEDPIYEESSVEESDAKHADNELPYVDDHVQLGEMSDQELQMMEEELTMIDIEAEDVDSDLLDHHDSYQLQLKKSKTSNIFSLEDDQGANEVLTLGDDDLDTAQEIDKENTDQLVRLEQKSSMDLSDVLQETGCVTTTSKTSCNESSSTNKLALAETEQTEAETVEQGEDTNESMEDFMKADGTTSATPSGSVATVLDLQKSTASDLVSHVMQNAVEKASSSQLEVAMDTTP